MTLDFDGDVEKNDDDYEHAPVSAPPPLFVPARIDPSFVETDLTCDVPPEQPTLPSLRSATLETLQRRQTPVFVSGATVASDRGVKRDRGKHRMHLLGPLWRPLRAVVRVLEFGAAKYAENNWQNVREEDGSAPPIKRYGNALQRHVAHFQEGKMIDEESGLHVLAHAACDALFLLWFLADDDGRERGETKPETT